MSPEWPHSSLITHHSSLETVVMTRCRLLPCLLLALVLGSAGHAQQVPWRKDYSAARQEAARTGRALLLHFTTDNCPWCVRLEQTTYRDPAIFKALTEQV